MAKDDVIEIEGIVTDALPNAMFNVDIGNDTLNLDYVVFCQVVTLPGCYFALSDLNKPDLFVIRC